MPELVPHSTPTPHPVPPALYAAPPDDFPAPPARPETEPPKEHPRAPIATRTSVKAWCDETEPPTTWKGASTAYRAGAKARAAGKDRTECRYGRDDLAEAWRAGFDGLDAFLAGGGVLLCEHCGRELEEDRAAGPEAPPPAPPSVPFSNDPRIPPPAYDWEDHPAFRFTFLMHYTKNADRLALEHIGAMLYDFALESGGGWPAWNETTTRAELRAVAADIRHAEAFLLAVAKERETVSLGVEDERLSFQAAHYAERCSSIAFGLESIVGPPWGARP